MPSASSGRALLRAGAIIAPAMTVATLLQYVLQVVAAKRLPTGDFGAFGSLLALMVLGAVPLFAVQAIVARRAAVSSDLEGVLRPALRCGLLVGAVAAVLAVPAAAFLHLPVLAALLVAVALVPLPVVGAALGLAQGLRRHREFAVLYLVYSGSRLLFVIPVLLVHPTTTTAMAAVAVASWSAAAVAGWVVLRAEKGSRHDIVLVGFGRDVVLTSLALLAVLALASTDLLLARHRLPAADSDLYALGSLGARAVFWLLQFAGVTVYAELAAHPVGSRRRTTFLTGLASVVALGAIGTVITAALPSGFVTTMLRPEYAKAVPVLPLFTALGTALAAAQYLMMAGLARGRRSAGLVLAGAAAVEAVVLALVPAPTVGRIAAVACAVTVVASGYLLAAGLRLVDVDHPGQGAALPGQAGGV